MSILDFFGFRQREQQAATADTATVRKIVDALERLDTERARYLAAFAYILSRVARADLKVTQAETLAMERIVGEHGALPEDQAILVVQIAKHQNRLFGATEDFLVTRELKSITTEEQRLALLDCLYGVAAAEDLVTLREDNEIRQIAGELGLTHRDFIAVRARYRDRLSVLQKDEPPKG